MSTHREVYELARRFLKDPSGIRFHEGTLFPFMTESNRMLQRKLAGAGLQVFIAEVEITVPQGTTSLSKTTTPALPTNFIVPWILKEKSDGVTGRYLPMEKKLRGLPDSDPVGRIYFWQWAANSLKLKEANRDTLVWIEYEQELPDISKLTDPVYISGSVGALAHGTAMLVDGSHAVEYEAAAELLIDSDVRASQVGPVRGIPYRHRFSN